MDMWIARNVLVPTIYYENRIYDIFLSFMFLSIVYLYAYLELNMCFGLQIDFSLYESIYLCPTFPRLYIVPIVTIGITHT